MIYSPLITALTKFVATTCDAAVVDVFTRKFSAEAMSCGIRCTERKALSAYFQKAAGIALGYNRDIPMPIEASMDLEAIDTAIQMILEVDAVKLPYADVLAFRRNIVDEIPILQHLTNDTWRTVFGIIDMWRMSTTITDEVWSVIAEQLGCHKPTERGIVRAAYFKYVHPYKAVEELTVQHITKGNVVPALKSQWGIEAEFLTEHEADLANVSDADVWAKTEQFTRYSGKVDVRAFRHEILCYKLNKRPVMFVRGQNVWIGPSDLEQLRYTEGLFEIVKPEPAKQDSLAEAAKRIHNAGEWLGAKVGPVPTVPELEELTEEKRAQLNKELQDMQRVKSEYKAADGTDLNLPAGQYVAEVDDVKVIDGKIVTTFKSVETVAAREERIKAIMQAKAFKAAYGDADPSPQVVSQRFQCQSPNPSAIPRNDNIAKLMIKTNGEGIITGTGLIMPQTKTEVADWLKEAINEEIIKQVKRAIRKRRKHMGLHWGNGGVDSVRSDKSDNSSPDICKSNDDMAGADSAGDASDKCAGKTCGAHSTDNVIRSDIPDAWRTTIGLTQAASTVELTPTMKERLRENSTPVHIVTAHDVDDLVKKMMYTFMRWYFGIIIAAIAIAVILRYYNFF